MATYGTESGIMNKDICKRIVAFQRKVLRRKFGEIKVNENWRKRYNKELMQMFGDLNALLFVKISRLICIFHVERMEN